MRTRFALEISEAKAAVDAGVAFALENQLAITVAVVDDSGTPMLVHRMDEASPASFDTAIEKARAAALTGVDTKILEAMIADRPALVTSNRLAIEGGLAILHKGQRVGGIGVSGASSDRDSAVAKVALEALP